MHSPFTGSCKMGLTIIFKYSHSETNFTIAMMMRVDKMAHSYVNPTIHSHFLENAAFAQVYLLFLSI